jgi:hypothetical protein
MKTRQKVPISARGLLQRINRVTSSSHLLFKKARRLQAEELGQYFAVDLRSKFVAEKNVDLEKKGRQLGVLKDYEALEKVRQ